MAHEYAQYIWSYFKGRINNDYGVAGLMGNLQAESALCPYRLQGDFSSGYATSIEYTAKVDSGEISRNDFIHNGPNGNGYGLAQWTFYTRKDELYERWSNGGYDSIGSIDLACDFLYYELGQYGLLDNLRNAKSVREASDVILHDFENPADQSESAEIRRASMGQAWYDKYAGTGGTVEPDEPDTPTPESPPGTVSDKPYTKVKKMSLLLLLTATKRKL